MTPAPPFGRTPRSAMEAIFSEIHRGNLWGDPESVSGPGSGLRRTALWRDGLAELLQRLGVRSLVDAPCGDFLWMNALALDLDDYVGVDVVPELVAANARAYARPGRRFLALDFTRDALPHADAVLCRDGLVHLSFADIADALRNFAHSAQWLIATTFTTLEANADIATGGWRPLNLQRPPFDFPAPIALLDERRLDDHGVSVHKHLGVWDLRGARA
jgi:hypothetical protein